ncbi:MAG: hypothetical protein R2830_14235 [Saprospiraceae bacterium]
MVGRLEALPVEDVLPQGLAEGVVVDDVLQQVLHAVRVAVPQLVGVQDAAISESLSRIYFGMVVDEEGERGRLRWVGGQHGDAGAWQVRISAPSTSSSSILYGEAEKGRTILNTFYFVH